MNEFTRTTLRINKLVLDQAKRIAFERDEPLQEVIEELLIEALSNKGQDGKRKWAANRIDQFRKSIENTGITAEKLWKESKRQLK